MLSIKEITTHEIMMKALVLEYIEESLKSYCDEAEETPLGQVFDQAKAYVSLVEKIEAIKCGPFFYEQTEEMVELKNIGYMRAIRTIRDYLPHEPTKKPPRGFGNLLVKP